MKEVLSVSKLDLDKRVAASKDASLRKGNLFSARAQARSSFEVSRYMLTIQKQLLCEMFLYGSTL